jgi:uncharacterized protein YbjT (DUF2867 family)
MRLVSKSGSVVRLKSEQPEEEDAMSERKRIAVVGATGRVGHHVLDVLEGRGHEVVAMSRASGVDVITGEGLPEALAGVEVVIDVATGSSAEEAAATEFFTTASRNLQEVGERSGVRRIVVVSIIGTDHYTAGYGAAKLAHERAAQAGPIPARILRAAQFHEFVPQLMEWGRRGDVVQVPKMRTQLVAARSVAEALADLTLAESIPADGTPEIAGPREEILVEMARLLAKRRSDDVRIEEVSDPDDPDREINESGGLLPGPDATLAGPTFEEWLDSTFSPGATSA